ncbi:Sau3AI family type II restriction endonuclease [Thermophilibacter mediterraneus]|uniref:Sau3AI family type II restriction endonuclease n=1 Tax=Thermophilibacter mediterraneus TaxID=1871031 RepID=UPI003207AD23
MDDVWLGYDPRDVDSIVEYAGQLRGKTLREVTNIGEIADPHRRRGAFGSALEEHYFKIDPNSRPTADFDGVGLELKATPLKVNKSGELVAKERLVLSMINFMTVVDESFETSHLMKKASNILLVSYLYEPGKSPLDYVIEAVVRWGFPEDDLPQIRRDWECIVNKVRDGHAEEISGGDTLYLEACTKAKDSTVRTRQPFSDVQAKPRAWALKASYMTAVQRKIIDGLVRIPRAEDEKDLDVLVLIRKRFAPFVGMTETALATHFGVSGSKDRCARITRKILKVEGDSDIEEFAKAGIVPKTIRLRKSGRPKEAMSFPAFDYFDLMERGFDESDFNGYLCQKYLFVLYREDDLGEYRLSDVCFWQMPEDDFDDARACYEQMRDNVRIGRADISVRSSENRCCHVRPHARNSEDTRPQPFGPPVVKKCFWLNQGYLQSEIERVLRS